MTHRQFFDTIKRPKISHGSLHTCYGLCIFPNLQQAGHWINSSTSIGYQLSSNAQCIDDPTGRPFGEIIHFQK